MFDLFSSHAGWGCFRECPGETGLGGSTSVARCDDVTKMMTVEGKYSHVDAVCVGMIESRCKKHRVAGIVPGVGWCRGSCPEGEIKSVGGRARDRESSTKSQDRCAQKWCLLSERWLLFSEREKRKPVR